MCLAQVHNTVMPVRLEPATPWYQVKHSTTEQLGSPTTTAYSCINPLKQLFWYKIMKIFRVNIVIVFFCFVF